MMLNVFLPFAGALLCSGLAGAVLFRGTRSFVHWTFVVGMMALALEGALTGLSFQAAVPEEVMYWQRLRIIGSAILPGTWLLFSLSFARANYTEFVARWKWAILATFTCPLALATLFGYALFGGVPVIDESSGWSVRVGWSGYVFSFVFLLGAVLILMKLEKTLRASAGSKRGQVKVMVLGLGGLFAVRIHVHSQVLLFSTINSMLQAIDAGALIGAMMLISVSLVHARPLQVDIYLSQTFLYNSLVLLVVGVYLLAVGGLAKSVTFLGGSQAVPLTAFLMFIALLGLMAVLLSDRLRQRAKWFINRQFHRPRYDYRKEWTAFTQRTRSLLNIKDLCAAAANMVSETFGVSSVTIWLVDETRLHLLLGGSTVFSETQACDLNYAERGAADLIRIMCDQPVPVDFDQPGANLAWDLKQANSDYFREARIRYCVSLVAGLEFLGLITLDERLTEAPFSVEDFDLLKTIADQAAASLLNLKLSERLLRAKEMEAFQTMSAFFLHDLKNMASTLSLTMQNLPAHYDAPVFRDDLLHTISQSVAKLNATCSRLSLMGQTLELEWSEVDLNDLVTATLAHLNGSLKAALLQDLHSLPRLTMDPEQLQKVLVNLVLSANDAVGHESGIRVATEQPNGWVTLSVSDNGCGMSKEFIARSLFHPFQTTKERDLGIGLFHSKKIVEAPQGRIEVESEEGKGSTFRVMLPIDKPSHAR